ncbi:ubiquinone biosynthesis protein coq7-like protein [Thermochaetoides thermophila DSM 1495]|uniref:5-demethoxyubiquinone hydroxylase, mitochondrial n=1 Tax=Chaetomium thermophilum (strain DSM 1495 / CBS 144.50 / IMI 039719) TaxID=759272 RepID=G0S9I3_CHATD|nr:ubiquinone biosynthesis protein coq7-like protein [Thermochaetoides thermophila DSM 1495]EGS20094.1 ubiquinone biosynthesis protein coq7-like protein [Thermochaetoides thermophila DSM 1495]
MASRPVLRTARVLLPATPSRLFSTTAPTTSTTTSSSSSSFSSSSSPTSPSSISQPKGDGQQPPKSTKGRKPLTPEQRTMLSRALRVNQAGELAATLIYTAQTPLVVSREPHLRPLMQHMYDQEEGHLRTFNELIHRHRVRPTALYPLWQVLATGLGWTTAMLGREAAMACTEAVETEIGGHYNGQIRDLLAMVEGWEREGYEVGEEFRSLIETLRKTRDEELEHLDHAVEHDARKAEPHWLLTGIIRLGCRGAIWVSERV